MKNKVYVLICFICISVLSLSGSQIKIDTPYGVINLADDDNSITFLEWLSQPSGIYQVDSINSSILIKTCKVSDGALSEILGGIIIEDIMNKPAVFINIINSYDETVLDELITQISFELYQNHQQSSNKIDEYDIFANNVTQSLKSIYYYLDNPRLSKFLTKIRETYCQFVDE